MTPHPTEYYLATALFTGYTFPIGGVWGALTDGPEVAANDLLDRVTEHFTDTAPTLATLKVWRFTDDCPPRDVTEDIIADVIGSYEEREAAREREYRPKYDEDIAAE